MRLPGASCSSGPLHLGTLQWVYLVYDNVSNEQPWAKGAWVMSDHHSELTNIFHRHDVALAYLFGSMAGPARRFVSGGRLDIADPLADIDLGVVFEDGDFLAEPEPRRQRYSELFNALTDIFPEDRLDLVFLQETHSVFQARAMTGHCVYAASMAFKAAYEERILARAADFRPFLERYYEERLGGSAP